MGVARRNAAVGIAVSLVVSAGAWWYFDTLLVFLVLPFVPVLLGRGDDSGEPVRECSRCDFRTRKGYDYCPNDGTRLE
jgi:hypothetical protein